MASAANAIPTPADWQQRKEEMRQMYITQLLEHLVKCLRSAIHGTQPQDTFVVLSYPTFTLKFDDPDMRCVVNQHFGAAGWDVVWSCDLSLPQLFLKPRAATSGSSSTVSATTGAAADAAADT
jgi:hypothetical protein